jgi:type II secretory ATPase GspE/PulE/Tfp pilus assembly ATPase PilB-like protein
MLLTLDPERVKSQRIANTIFPKHKIIYTVTTQREFNATVEQFYGSSQDEIGAGDINEMLTNLGAEDVEETAGEIEESSAATDNELVKLVNKIIIDALYRSSSRLS